MQKQTLRTILVSVISLIAAQANAEIISLIDIELNGFQTVPSTGSLATGLASVLIDTETRDFTVTGEFSGLEGDVLFGHLHGRAGFGETSNLIYMPLLIEGDFMRSGTFHASQRLSASQLSVILDSRSYLNIHTTAFLGGEIRGQIVVPAPGGLSVLALGGLVVTRRRR